MLLEPACFTDTLRTYTAAVAAVVVAALVVVAAAWLL